MWGRKGPGQDPAPLDLAFAALTWANVFTELIEQGREGHQSPTDFKKKKKGQERLLLEKICTFTLFEFCGVCFSSQ